MFRLQRKKLVIHIPPEMRLPWRFHWDTPLDESGVYWVDVVMELSVNYHGLFPIPRDRFYTWFKFPRELSRKQPSLLWPSTPRLSMRSFSILDYLLSFIQSGAPIKYEVPCSGFTWQPMDHLDF